MGGVSCSTATGARFRLRQSDSTRARNRSRRRYLYTMALAVSDDAELLLAAMAYIGAVHRAEATNMLPAPGVGECVLESILTDPALSDYVRKWARSTKINATEWTPEDLPLPPIDATYERVRALLRACGDKAHMASGSV
jgi:hypothetical protein